ncbi:MAG: trigger factor, partial [candidate division Zixibacteria bacterium]|nr:trigger factor [candidate division Zixibacteria bacterium]
MKVEIKQSDGLKRELAVAIPAETVNSSMEKKFGEVRHAVTLKGFRKGKAPMEMIKTIYAEQVKADVVDELIKSTYPVAVKEKTLNVASYPKLTDIKFSDDGGFNYTAEVEVFPEIDKVKFDGLSVQGMNVDATDAEVEEATEGLRKRLSEFRILDREARIEDVVVVDLKKIYDPKMALEATSFPKSEIDLANPVTVKEFREQIPGMKAGDEKEITVRYDDAFPDPSFAGAEIKYLCKLKEVKERIMPEINDAFAKSSGIAETALEMKLKIRTDIKAHKGDSLNRAYKRDIVRQICEKNDIPIPEGLVHDYLDSVIEDMKKREGKVDEAQIRKDYHEMAINTLRWDILWNQLAEQEKIEVLPSDTENWISGFAARNGMTAEQASEALNRSGKTKGLRESMREEKTLDFLV